MLVIAALLSNTAQAGPAIGAEYLLSFNIGDGAAEVLGDGIAGRIGWSLDLLAITFTPEVGATVWLENRRFVPEVGVRMQFAKIIEPGLYAHFIAPTFSGAQTGWDAGVTVDLTAIPKVDIGLQAGAMSFDGNPFVTAGGTLHVNL
ncbi:MAG: hypothetical protein AAF602_12370 [Myxococcota bacterium]